MVESVEVRLRGVVDVGGVDFVVAAADDAQAAGARALTPAAAGSGDRPGPRSVAAAAPPSPVIASLAASTAFSAMVLVVA
jgi:hypothetical protein